MENCKETTKKRKAKMKRKNMTPEELQARYEKRMEILGYIITITVSAIASVLANIVMYSLAK